MSLPFWSWSPFIIAGLQVICIVHLLRRGGNREWLYLLIFLPFIGSLIYVVNEILPSLRNSGANIAAGSKLFSGGRIKELEKQVRLADTDANRLRLAAAYAQNGAFDSAMDLTRSCLKGIYAENPGMMQDMARYSFGAGKFAESIMWFDKVHAVTDRRIAKPENELIYARALEMAGEQERAFEAYRYVIRMHHSMEARYRYGMMLRRQGQDAEARRQFQAILDEREHHPSHVRRQSAEWIRGAKAALRNSGQGIS